MAGWVGTTMALSLLVIALCFLGIAAGVFLALREALERGQSLAREIGELRRDLAPTLAALGRLGKEGAEVAELDQLAVVAEQEALVVEQADLHWVLQLPHRLQQEAARPQDSGNHLV